MILITGGLGFIGSHTTRALLDLGESCVLVQRRPARVPAAFADETGRRVFAEQADIADLPALLRAGQRRKITGIVHLAQGFGNGPGDPLDGARTGLAGLLNVLQAARDWQVQRVGIASTIGVYDGGGQSPLREDMPLPLTAVHPIPASMKIGELLAGYIAAAAGIEILSYRISAAWGPLGRPASSFFAAPALVHAAVRGVAPDLSALRAPAQPGDGLDMCYVKDIGRAIALLQLAGQLRSRVYNVAAGRPTTNADLIAGIRNVIPDAQIELPQRPGAGEPGPASYLDITRLRQDTGYQPAYDTDRAVADYIGWLRAGNQR